MNGVAGSYPEARDYRAYGLRFRSEIALPFSADDGQAEPEVTIRRAAVPETTVSGERRRIWESTSRRFLLNVDGVARYLVRDGREILVEPAGDCEAAVSLYLEGSVLAACLQQRGILTLHASAVATGSGAILFAGSSGSGKSTLAAAFLERGYAMLADDVTGVVFDADGRPTALPGFPSLRLWADAVDKLDWRARTRGRVRDELDKFVAPVDRFRAARLPVRSVFVLSSHNRTGFEIESKRPAAAFEMLLRYTYRKRYLRGSGPRGAHFRAVAALTRFAPLTGVVRPAHPFRLDALADEIERCLEGLEVRPH